MIDNLPFLVVAITILLGLYALLLRKDLIKMIMGISLIEAGVNLFLIALGYRWESVAPIFTGAPSLAMVMPTVQALTLTSIVIGVATLALLLSMVMIIYRHYHTTDVREVTKLQG